MDEIQPLLTPRSTNHGVYIHLMTTTYTLHPSIQSCPRSSFLYSPSLFLFSPFPTETQASPRFMIFNLAEQRFFLSFFPFSLFLLLPPVAATVGRPLLEKRASFLLSRSPLPVLCACRPIEVAMMIYTWTAITSIYEEATSRARMS